MFDEGKTNVLENDQSDWPSLVTFDLRRKKLCKKFMRINTSSDTLHNFSNEF